VTKRTLAARVDWSIGGKTSDMGLTHLAPTDWSGFSDGFRSTVHSFKPPSEEVRDEAPGTFDDIAPRGASGGHDAAEREDQPVPV
jgi:hypothetical protein